MRTGYRTFCSKKCLATSKYTKEKKIKTNLEKWGVENPSQNNEIRKKVKETNLQKFGVEYPLQSKEILEKLIYSSALARGFLLNLHKKKESYVN